jgi:hypothetical protein
MNHRHLSIQFQGKAKVFKSEEHKSYMEKSYTSVKLGKYVVVQVAVHSVQPH